MSKKEIIVVISEEEMSVKNFVFNKKTDLDKSYNIKRTALERAKMCFEAFGKISAGIYELKPSIVKGCYTFYENGVELSRERDFDYAIENFVDWASWL